MTARFRFVDGISASANVRLDLLDGLAVGVLRNGIDLTPAATRYVTTESMMSDGARVVASAKGGMLLRLPLKLQAATDDGRQALFDSLVREVERPEGFIEARLRDRTTSRWLHYFRGSVVDFDPHLVQDEWRVTVELPADPHAYGLLQTLASVSVSTNPAAVTNPQMWDITGIVGDVPAPLILWTEADNSVRGMLFAVRSRGIPANLRSTIQAESSTDLGTDTTLMANDPLMSGAGSNYLRTTFASPSLLRRFTVPVVTTTAEQVEAPGEFRVLARLRLTGGSPVVYAQWLAESSQVALVGPRTLLIGTNWVDLGVLPVGSMLAPGGLGASMRAAATFDLSLFAERVSGSGSLDWDVIRLVPADESFMVVDGLEWLGAETLVVDGGARAAYTTRGSPFAADAATLPHQYGIRGGGFPHVTPGVTNRIFTGNLPEGVAVTDLISTTWDINAAYYPRYLSV